MDLNAIDQMFTLTRRHLVVEYVTYRRNQTRIKEEIRQWLADNKVPYTFSATGGGTGVIHITDRSQAVLFKLSWM